MPTLIVIPARWGSTRFPGKPLVEVAGQTLLQRVITVATAAAAQRPKTTVVVATDDDRIANHAEALGQSVAITAASISSGTERALAAASAASSPPRLVINLQGDAPFTSPRTLLAIIDALDDGASVATPVVQLDWQALDELRQHKITSPFSGTTCVRAKDGRALWFSKQIIPAIRDEDVERRASALSPVFRHIGVYGYTRLALTQFCAAPAATYERIEQLEQLRFFDLGIPIQTVTVSPDGALMNGIDTPADLARANRFLAVHGEPNWT